MHLHGHDFLLLAAGEGVFTDSVLQSANLTNPTRRDVTTMPASGPKDPNQGGYIVIAFKLNNPGVWVTPFPSNTDDRLFIVTLRSIYPWAWDYNLSSGSMRF